MGDIGVLSDGSILLFDARNYEAYTYREGTAAYLAKFKAGGRYGWLDLGEGRVAVRMAPAEGYKVVQASTGEILEEIVPAELVCGDGLVGSRLRSGSDGLYLAGGNGIYQKKTGEEWKQLAEAKETVLYDPDVRLRDFLPDNAGGFYLLLEDGLWHYRPEQPGSVKKKTLRIASLYPVDLIKKQVIEFQTAHPEAGIEYKFYLAKGVANQEEEKAAREKLSAELLTGDAPDVLVLDDLPWESYARKGYLRDLQPILADILTDDDFLGDVIAGYCQDDDKLYTAVAAFEPVLFVLREGTPETVRTLEGLQKFLEGSEDRTGFLPSVYNDITKERLAQCLYQLYGRELQEENGLPDRLKCEAYLRVWKWIDERIEKKNVQRSVTLPWEGEEFKILMNGQEGDFAVQQNFWSIASYMPGKTEGFSFISSGKYLPRLKVGIWEKSGRQELAAEFLQSMFYRQKEEKDYLTTVCKSAFAAGEEEAIQGIAAVYGRTYTAEDGFIYQLNQPEDIPEMLALCEECRTPTAEKDERYEILLKNFLPCLKGEENFETACDSVYEALMLYREEQLP